MKTPLEALTEIKKMYDKLDKDNPFDISEFAGYCKAIRSVYGNQTPETVEEYECLAWLRLFDILIDTM